MLSLLLVLLIVVFKYTVFIYQYSDKWNILFTFFIYFIFHFIFIYLFIYLFTYLFIYLSIFIFYLFYLFIYFHFIYLFIFFFVCIFFFHANLPYCLTLLWVTLSFSNQCIYLCKQCRFICIVYRSVFRYLTKTHICKNVRDKTRRWNSPFHKHWGERVYSNTIS